ncbi:Amino acid permease [Modicisalibacter muralis]|uniref:Amino acid permease n=1 Tax=Modicisalibacter muralis TaxID=119000 RepID=A0A1G9F5X0_9GAMM|nr:APC family permease [Halomonas muralis]SDK83751.1 Amino acid permease [Halomonas muralis]
MESETRDNSLTRSMGPIGATATVVAGTLGAGLFVTIGTASGTTGPSVILAVALTGVIAMAVAMNYSWMATIFPGAGGAYTLVSRTFRNRLAGFVVTWTKWLGYMAADAVLAIGFGNYLKVFYPSIDPALSGFALLTVLFLINLIGTKGYSTTQNVMFWLLIAAILVLVVPGLVHIDTANYRPFFTGGMSGLVASAVPLFYAFIGIEVAAQFSAEVKNPGRNLPLAMLGGTGILILLYMLTAVVIYGVVNDYTVLADSARPLATAANVFLGEYAVAVVAIGGLLATATSVHAVMAAGIKIPYAWSWDSLFPQWFSTVSKRFRTPHWSLLTLYAAACALTFWSGGLDRAIAIATFSYLIAYLAVSLAAGYIYLKRADMASRAAFQPGGWFYVPIVVAVLGSGAIISQAANWVALFSGDFAALSTLAIYIPWLAVGLVVFTLYWYLGKQRGIDVDAILDTIPGASKESAYPGER